MKLKIIFDKESLNENCISGWGIAYLIAEKVLFDAAEKGEYLLKNLEGLNVDIQQIEKVVISHNRWNHRAGIWDLLKANRKIEILAGSDFLAEFKDKLLRYNFRLIRDAELIAENIYTTGCLPAQEKESKIMEQALLIYSEKGVSLLLACAHPGVLAFMQKAKEIFPKERLYALIGGFHLMDKEKRFIDYIAAEIKAARVKNIGPAYCTGFNALNILKKTYLKNFFEIKIGQEIEL